MNAPLDPSCWGKTPYLSKADALSCIRHRVRKPKNGRGGLIAYRCGRCGQWHVGSLSFRTKEYRR